MVDIHSHILPGLDDGARSMSETIEMIEIARAAGTTAIVASPHADTQYEYKPDRIEELSPRPAARQVPASRSSAAATST